MAKIYSRAERVIVWLGEASGGSDRLFSFLNNVSHDDLRRFEDRIRTHEKLPQDFLLKRANLLERSYWDQTWIIQELYMASRMVYQCGPISRVDEIRMSYLLREDWLTKPENNRETHVKLLTTKAGRGRIRRHAAERSRLPRLLRQYWRTKCADQRDKIYALLGILPEDDQAGALSIDYSISASQLYARVCEVLKYFPGVINPGETSNTEILRCALQLTWSQIAGLSYEVETDYISSSLKTMHYDPELAELVVDIDETPSVGQLSSVTTFTTMRKMANERNIWSTTCEIEAGDLCWTIGIIPRYYAILFSQTSGLCIGSATLPGSYKEFDTELQALEQALATAILSLKIVTTPPSFSRGGNPGQYISIPRALLSAIWTFQESLRSMDRYNA